MSPTAHDTAIDVNGVRLHYRQWENAGARPLLLLHASGCGGRLELERLPLSDALRHVFDVDAARQLALSGGDDYELCFTGPAHAEETLRRIGDEIGVPIARIGKVVEGDRLICTDVGDVVEYNDVGYTHFAVVNR